MSDNVIILGAGYSYDSGVPLLRGLVERMWEYCIRERTGTQPLSSEDIQIFSKAMKVRDELDGYHGRATFDDRNIEDILSILTFNVLAGSHKDKEKLADFNRAISRTIELSCSVTHPGVNISGGNTAINTGPELYRSFWCGLFELFSKKGSLPTIITFNYDLVIERSLLQVLINTKYYNGYKKQLPFKTFEVNYNYNLIDNPKYSVNYVSYNDADFKTVAGTILVAPDANDPLKIDILKLHGSQNFPQKRQKQSDGAHNFAQSLNDPYILPPIFDKLSSMESSDVWKTALQRLRTAKNIIIVGYSLPRTDIYMQYFLKAAVGPNLNLNKIIVFDPVLFLDTNSRKEMEERYEECFSPQMKPRIIFRPKMFSLVKDSFSYGSADHFVKLLREEPDSIFF